MFRAPLSTEGPVSFLMSDLIQNKIESAIVLPGAVARGAYEAGVLDALAQRGVKINHIVATSSGALNGLAFAVGVRRGKEKQFAAELVNFWITKGCWKKSFNFRPWNFFTGRGISNQDCLRKLIKEIVNHDQSPSPKHHVEFKVIVTPLNGVEGYVGERCSTTYEEILSFKDEDFDTEESLERIFDVVLAACAFPGLFSSVSIPKLGKCVDGGVVNNAPISYAVENPNVHQVFVPIPFSSVMPKNDWKGGFTLLNHLIAILINERLFRDLKNAHVINCQSLKLDEMVKEGFLNLEQAKRIRSDLSITPSAIVEIRPRAHLNCSPFTAFFFRKEREDLVAEGRKAALAAVGVH